MKRLRNLIVSMTDINARLASGWIWITCMQNDVDKMCTYLDTLVTHTMSPQLLHPSTCREILDYIKRGVEQHPWLALLNDPYQDILIYYKLLKINSIVFDYHSVIFLQVCLLDKSLIWMCIKFVTCEFCFLFCRTLFIILVAIPLSHQKVTFYPVDLLGNTCCNLIQHCLSNRKKFPGVFALCKWYWTN